MTWFTSEHKDQGFIEAQQISARLPEILLEAQKIASTVQTGMHGRRKQGLGDHFWQYRNYDPSADSASRIDWRQSARSDHLYVREQEDERAQTAVIWLDPSAAMHYSSSSDHRTKYEYGFLLANVLGYQLTAAGERVECHIKQSDKVAVNHPKHMARFADILLRCPNTPYFDHRPNQTVILISDFLNQDMDTLHKMVRGLVNMRADIHIVSIFDPAEEKFSFEGHIKFEDMQASDEFEIQDASALKQEYETRFLDHNKQVASLVKNKNKVMSVNTARPPVDVSMRLTQMLLSF